MGAGKKTLASGAISVLLVLLCLVCPSHAEGLGGGYWDYLNPLTLSKKAVGTVWGATKSTAEFTADTAKKTVDVTSEAVKKTADFTVDSAKKTADFTVDTAKKTGKAVKDTTENAVDLGVDVTKAAGKGLKDGGGHLVDGITTVGEFGVDAVKGGAKLGVDVAKGGGKLVLDGANKMGDVAVDGVNLAVDGVVKTGEVVGDVAKGGLKLATEGGEALVNGITKTGSYIVNGVVDTTQFAGNVMVVTGQGIGDAVVEGVGKAGHLIKDGRDAVQYFVHDGAGILVEDGKAFIKGSVKAIKAGLHQLTVPFEKVAHKIKEYLNSTMIGRWAHNDGNQRVSSSGNASAPGFFEARLQKLKILRIHVPEVRMLSANDGFGFYVNLTDYAASVAYVLDKFVIRGLNYTNLVNIGIDKAEFALAAKISKNDTGNNIYYNQTYCWADFGGLHLTDETYLAQILNRFVLHNFELLKDASGKMLSNIVCKVVGQRIGEAFDRMSSKILKPVFDVVDKMKDFFGAKRGKKKAKRSAAFVGHTHFD